MSTVTHKILLSATLFFSVCNVFAQKDSDKGNDITKQEVTVVKEYEATIQDAQKVNMQPGIPDIEEKKLKLDYTIPTRDFKDIAFEANPLKPLSISKEKLEKFNSSFIKIGFGSQLSPLVQLAYNDNKSKNLKFGIFYDHFSAYGFAIKNQRFSDDLAGAYLKYYPKTYEVGVQFAFRNLRTHFYGTDSTYTEKQVRQVFRNYDANVYFKNAQKNKLEVDFIQTLNFNYLQETFGGAKEWFIAGRTDIKKTFLKYHSAGFRFDFDVSQLKRDSTSLNRGIYTPEVGYSYNNDDWKAHGFFGFNFYGKRAIFATDVHLEKRLYEHAIIVYIDYTHGLHKNSLRSFAQANNFIQDNINIQNSVVGDLGIGFKGTAGNFNYNAAFHLVHMEKMGMPLFVNDTADMKRFQVVYDSNTVIFNGHFELGYNAREWLRLSLLGDYNYYKLKSQARAWNEPAFKATMRANYIWKNKISLNFDLYGITSSSAILPEGKIVTLKGTADINLGIEYIMNKHIAFFGNINNIAHIKYQQYYHYSSYGINGLVGGKFSF